MLWIENFQKTQKNEQFLLQIPQKLLNYSPLCFLVISTKYVVRVPNRRKIGKTCNKVRGGNGKGLVIARKEPIFFPLKDSFNLCFSAFDY